MVTGGPTVQMTGGQRLASERIVAIVDSTHLLILNFPHKGSAFQDGDHTNQTFISSSS
jgi:hypothetical protein